MARARNEQANETTSTNKRSFSFNSESLLEEVPLLPTGTYAATLIGCSVVGKEDKQHIQVNAERTWNKEAKKWEFTGDFIIKGNIYYGAELTGKGAKTILGKDEPRFYGGKIELNTVKFNPEEPEKAWYLDSNKNTCLAKAMKIININMDELVESVGHKPMTEEGEPTFDLDQLKETFESVDSEDEIDYSKDRFPEEVFNHPDVEYMLNFVLFYREWFSLITQQMNLQPVGLNIIKEAGYPDKTVQVNNISLGGFTPTSAGFIAFKEGME